jgi:hypothetical protein
MIRQLDDNVVVNRVTKVVKGRTRLQRAGRRRRSRRGLPGIAWASKRRKNLIRVPIRSPTDIARRELGAGSVLRSRRRTARQ